MRRALLLALLAATLAWALDVQLESRVLPRYVAASPAPSVGSFHVHSSASHDGRLDLDTIARAAHTDGLDFVLVTDHNAQTEAPREVDGVTVLSYAELSTLYGHVVELGGTRLLSERERKRSDVLATIRAAGGAPILTHPTDVKRPWEGAIGAASGLEIANLAASARRHLNVLFLDLVPAALAWPLRPRLALAQLYDRDRRALERWDGESDPHYVGLCGNDAHGLVDARLNMLGWLVGLDARLPRAASERPAAITRALTSGRFFCFAGLLGTAPRFQFEARGDAGRIAASGDTVTEAATEELYIEAPRLQNGRARLTLLRNGQPILTTRRPEVHYPRPLPGSYRVEVRTTLPNVLGGERDVPILYSNRLRVVRAAEGALP